jgi:phosphoglycerate kinase
MSHIAAIRLDKASSFMKQGAKVMLMSHRGRPIEGEVSDEFTLQPVADRLSELLGVTVRLEKNWLDGVE